MQTFTRRLGMHENGVGHNLDPHFRTKLIVKYPLGFALIKKMKAIA